MKLSTPFPATIQDFEFQKQFFPNDSHGGHYVFALYKKGNTLAFCKLTTKPLNSSEVKLLKNEIAAYFSLNSLKAVPKLVSVPKLYASHLSHQCSYFLVDFIDGVGLRNQSVDEMILGYEILLDFLATASPSLEHRKHLFFSKSTLDLFIAFHGLLLISLVKHLDLLTKLPSILFNYYRGIFNAFSTPYGIVHRDIGGNNCLVANQKYHLIDFQYFSWAPLLMENANLFVTRAWTPGFSRAFLESKLLPSSSKDKNIFRSLSLNAIMIDIATEVGNKYQTSLQLIEILNHL